MFGRLAGIALATSILVVSTGTVAAASYRSATLRTYYGATASTLIVTGTGTIHLQPSMTDEGYSQRLAVRLWVHDGRSWAPIGDWRYALTRNVLERTGASVYWNYGPIRATGNYCFYAYYSWQRSGGWVGLEQHLGCYTF